MKTHEIDAEFSEAPEVHVVCALICKRRCADGVYRLSQLHGSGPGRHLLWTYGEGDRFIIIIKGFWMHHGLQ